MYIMCIYIYINCHKILWYIVIIVEFRCAAGNTPDGVKVLVIIADVCLL